MSIEILITQLVIDYLPFGGLDRQPDDIRFIFSIMLPDADHITEVYYEHAAGDIRALKTLLQLAPHLVPKDILNYVTSPAKADLIISYKPNLDLDVVDFHTGNGNLLMVKYFATKCPTYNRTTMWHNAFAVEDPKMIIYALAYPDDEDTLTYTNRAAQTGNVIAFRIAVMLYGSYRNDSWWAARTFAVEIIYLLGEWGLLDISLLFHGAAAGNQLDLLRDIYADHLDQPIDINESLVGAVQQNSLDTAEQLCIWGARVPPFTEIPARLRKYHL